MRSTIAKQILAETPKETKIFVNLYADIVVRVNQILKAKKWSQKDLANQIGKNPSEINKWLKGEHNFTLKSLAKLEAELGESIIKVETKNLSLNINRAKSGFTIVHRKDNYEDVKFNKPSASHTPKKQKPILAYVG